MKIPKSITLKNKKWKVKFKKKLTFEGEAMAGLCHKSDRVIELEENADRDELTYTFFHECLHALIEEYGFEEKHPGYNSEEKFVLEVEKLAKRFFKPK